MQMFMDLQRSLKTFTRHCCSKISWQSRETQFSILGPEFSIIEKHAGDHPLFGEGSVQGKGQSPPLPPQFLDEKKLYNIFS